MYNLFLEFDNDGTVENVYSIEVFLSRFLSLLFMATVILLNFLLKKILQRHNIWNCYQHYCKQLAKQIYAKKRVAFLKECKKNGLVPDFLKFRVPDNNCFDPSSVKNFQLRLLSKELHQAIEEVKRKENLQDVICTEVR